MRVLVLQHVECEPPGVYADVLGEHDVAIDVVDAGGGGQLPDSRAFDGILAMGGPMSANDLVAGQRLIGDAVRAGKAYFGVCLGAQLLAASFGAAVCVAPVPEIGLLPVLRTAAGAADPVFARTPVELPAFHWHSDAFEVPRGGVLLWSSAACRNQAFRIGSHAYGVQFHLEATASMVRRWARLPDYAASLERVGGTRTLVGLVADLERHQPELRRAARAVLADWIEHCLVPAAISKPREVRASRPSENDGAWDRTDCTRSPSTSDRSSPAS